MAIVERETSAQIGEGLTGVMRSGHFWQVGSIASLDTGREILVAFWPKNGLRRYLRVPICTFKKLRTIFVRRSKIVRSDRHVCEVINFELLNLVPYTHGRYAEREMLRMTLELQKVSSVDCIFYGLIPLSVLLHFYVGL